MRKRLQYLALFPGLPHSYLPFGFTIKRWSSTPVYYYECKRKVKTERPRKEATQCLQLWTKSSYVCAVMVIMSAAVMSVQISNALSCF